MIIEVSLWERIGSYDSSSAQSRERFAEKLDASRKLAYAKRPQVRTSSFQFTDLQAQDISIDRRNAA